MSQSLDLFGPAVVVTEKPEPATPRTPPAASMSASAPDRAGRINMPCERAACGWHVCRVGGGHASLSDDGGLSWVCYDHAPADFMPGARA